MAEIPLSKGKVAIVDDADLANVSIYKWHAVEKKGTWYAARSETTGRYRHRQVYMHREILGLAPKVGTDHVNGDGLDNRRFNIRPATKAQNGRNTNGCRNRRSKFKGVSWHRDPKMAAGGRWRYRLHLGTRCIAGYARTEEEAAIGYNKLARAHFGEFARLNEAANG